MTDPTGQPPSSPPSPGAPRADPRPTSAASGDTPGNAGPSGDAAANVGKSGDAAANAGRSGDAPETDGPPADRGPFILFVALALAVAAFLLGEIRMRPPAPAGIGAPTTEFSAARASNELRTLFRDVPRPVGSAEHERTRERLVARLTELGLDPKVEEHWMVSPGSQTAAHVRNVVARLPGTETGPAIHILSHYDSVAAGPGASDAGACVAAIVEGARALKAGPPLRRDVVFLLTDAEEAGLLGARAYLREHGRDGILAVVNLEARGTEGPSLMFESGRADAWAVAAWKSLAPRPVSSSIFSAIYRSRLIPNDTDYSVFRDEGVPGLNFAFVGGVLRYHTPLDSFAHSDLGSLQHHGDNLLAAVRGLAASADPPAEAPDGVWFDLFGAAVAGASADRIPRHSLIAGALVVLTIVLRFARGDVRTGEGLVALAAALVAPVAALACVFGTGALLVGTGALPSQHVASPGAAVAAAAGAAVAGAGLIALVARRWAGPAAFQSAIAFVLAAGAAVLARAVPQASYLLVMPALLVGAAGIGLAVLNRRVPATVETCVGVAALSILALPLVPLLMDGVGPGPIPGLGGALVVVSVPFVLVAWALVPCIAAAGRRAWLVPAAGIAVALAASAVQMATDAATAESPAPLRFVWSRDEADHHAKWAALSPRPLPAEVAAVAEWSDDPERVLPWRPERGRVAEAPTNPVLAPAMLDLRTTTVDGSRRVKFRLASQRGAHIVVLAIEPNARLRRMFVGGVPVLPETIRDDGRPYVLTCPTTPREGLDFELEFASATEVTAFVADVTYGLPPWAAETGRARPADRVPAHGGDQAVVYRKVRL